MITTKLKVGDRVKVYGHVCASSKWLGSHWAGAKGTVTEIMDGYAAPGAVAVKFDQYEVNNRVVISVNQCRRLVSRRKDRLWVLRTGDNVAFISALPRDGYDEYRKMKR